MMTFALLAPYQILEVCLWQGKSESDIHGTYFFLKFQKSAKKLSPWTLEILAPTVTYFKKNTFGAKILTNLDQVNFVTMVEGSSNPPPTADQDSGPDEVD